MRINVYLIFICSVLICACSSIEKPKTNEPKLDNPTRSTYPSLDAYPSYLPESEINLPYPSVEQSSDKIGLPNSTIDPNQNFKPKFEINEPLIAGSLQVTGKGPKNVPIILVDITEMGEILANTTVNSVGKFMFDLQRPLIKSHAVGLQIGDLSGTEFNYSDFASGDNYQDRPLIGILFAIATIVDK